MDPAITAQLADEAVDLAGRWLDRAAGLATPPEQRRRRRLARLVSHPADKTALAALIDRSFRSRDGRRAAEQIRRVLRDEGIPDFFPAHEKGLIHLFLRFARFLPWLSVPLVNARIRSDSRHLIAPGERARLDAFLAQKQAEGLRVNINRLGEEVLGEEEAQSHMAAYLADLRNPLVEGIAVKISSICAQIHPLPFEETVAAISERLAVLYREAAARTFTRPDGRRAPKSVTLDMEAYRDLALTAAAFTRTLDREEFKAFSAGMALQAYLPDSLAVLEQVAAWARRRVAAGGSPVRIRVVKGANMEMERLESSLRGWPLAPHDDKRDTDANWKRMVCFALEPENSRAVGLGAASHNLFDLAFAWRVAQRNRAADASFTVEMIEGMADPLGRAVRESVKNFSAYAPVAEKRHFINAVAYLIRRLDENTGPQNFLRHLSMLERGTPAWRRLEERFRASVRRMPHIGTRPHRTQNRLTESFPSRRGAFHTGIFRNEPDTDWSLAANRTWAADIRGRWMKTAADAPVTVPVVVAGRELAAGRKILKSVDLNQLPRKLAVARCALARPGDVGRALAAAVADPDGWRRMSFRRRHRILSAAADEIRKARGDLIGAAAATTGKVFTEADPEVSEAVDFAEYYPHSARAWGELRRIRCRGKGVGVVISPFNFPIAIPCGGISAALAAGNTVIFKPSSDAILVGWLLCRCFWRAGVSQHTLQFLPCEGGGTGTALTADPRVDFVILTGGTETGLRILAQRPELQLAAETGGKNAVVVTAMADREQAAGDVVASAFGHSGQKCSAASLLVLEPEVYADASFRRQLVDAAATFRAGSAWDFTSKTGPLVRPPRGPLAEALTKLLPGESWALEPRVNPDNPNLWSPGIKWGVRPDSTTHMTEFFGPVLGVMRAADLHAAVALVNRTGYGLTSGLESLDMREQRLWKEAVRAGNLYVNRGTTGAITLRQPFGGMGKSALGEGIKAGGAHYVTQFMDFEETAPPAPASVAGPHPLLRLAQRWQLKLDWGGFGRFAAEMRRVVLAIQSYLERVDREFGREIDPVRLRGQDNVLRHLPVGTVIVRLHPADTIFEALARIAAVRATGNRLRVSVPPGVDTPATRFLYGSEGLRLTGAGPVFQESDAELIAALPRADRIRYAAPERVPSTVYRAAAQTGFPIVRAPVLAEGRIELIHYYRQQSICTNYHRHGYLGARAAAFTES